MEDHTLFTLAFSAAPLRTFHIVMTAGLFLHAVVVAVSIGILYRWGRDMKTWRARREREHQEYMVACDIDAQRRTEDHARRMKEFGARR